MEGADIFLAFIAFLFPPLAVWVKCGLCSADSLINILLSSLGYIPGLLHAWYIIAKYPDGRGYEQVPQHDCESGRHVHHGQHTERVTYVFVPTPQASPQPQHQHQQGSKSKSNKSGGSAMNYGTTSNPAAAAGPSSSSAPAHQNSGGSNEVSGSSGNDHDHDRAPPPPTYAEAVKGDYKIQSDN
ncbi:putative stress response RCI peptide [Xylariaceae sp. FL0594]|nr:putative stress response RCI peptide [Xylariaceae sp. FL0594]